MPSKEASTPAGRTLQPRPPTFASVNGQTVSPYQSSPTDEALQPARKKRGRPSKADVEARTAAAAAKGELYQPLKVPKLAQATPSRDEPAPARPSSVAIMNASASPVLETADPGSGKKRRGRPTKEEAQAKRLLLEAAAVAASGQPAGEASGQPPSQSPDRAEIDLAGAATTTEAVDEPAAVQTTSPQPDSVQPLHDAPSSETLPQLSNESKET